MTTMPSVLVLEREMEGHVGNPSVIGRIILKSGKKMSEEWKRSPSGSKGGPVIPTNNVKKLPFIQKLGIS